MTKCVAAGRLRHRRITSRIIRRKRRLFVGRSIVNSGLGQHICKRKHTVGIFHEYLQLIRALQNLLLEIESAQDDTVR